TRRTVLGLTARVSGVVQRPGSARGVPRGLGRPQLGGAAGRHRSSSGGDRPSRRSRETCSHDAPRRAGAEGRQAMDIGPVEYLILGFPGNNFTGQIVPELAKL